MCLKSSNKASRAAEESESKRRAEISAAQKRISNIFGSPQREADILDLENATRQFLQSDLDREKTDADRGLKFALARSGLSKGSVDIDQNLRLGDDFLRGILDIERRAKGAGANLRSQDAQTQAGLFSQVLSGLDATTAAQQANAALGQNIALTKSQSLQGGFDNLFSDFSDIFKNSKVAAGERRNAFDFNTRFGPRQRPTAIISGGI